MTMHMTEYELKMMIRQLNLDTNELNHADEFKHNGKDSNENFTYQDGWIQVKDQTIIVHDPVDGGKFPVISSIGPVQLQINDKKVDSEYAVSSSDRIDWEIIEKPLFVIRVSEDKLYTFFHLNSKERFAWRLVNTELLSKIIISAEEDRDIVLETLHLSDIFMQLEKKSIKSNLDIASIQQELIDPTHKPVMIAKGKAATPGKDAQLEIYFSEQVESQFYELGGSIDFRNHLQIPSVKKGEMIAKKIQLVDGIPGYDVYGNIVFSPTPKDVIITAKSNVQLTSDGEVIALKEGRPRITGGKIKTFDITTSYIVTGDVDIHKGNIIFSGDVIVYGNVTDNMIIESLGNVYVYGSVYNATITATGSIHIRGNVMGGKLYSGYFGVMFNRLYHTSKGLSDKVEQLLLVSQMLIQGLEQRKQMVRFGQVILLLIENKFNDIPAEIKGLLSLISNIQHIKNEEYQKLMEQSEIFLQPLILLETATLSFVQGYLALLCETHQEVQRMQEDKVQIILNQCHNSELKSNGDIVIVRDGVILSDLYSAGNIVFKCDFAVCRGSQLEAGGSIFAKIIGGQTGAITFLKAKKQVTVKKIYAARVCVGKYCADIIDLVENKTFSAKSLKERANDEGHLLEGKRKRGQI